MSTVKLDGWKPHAIPDEDRSKIIRQMVREAVFSKYNRFKQPSNLEEIYRLVKAKMIIAESEDKFPWKIAIKRTVDRRVNEAASVVFCLKHDEGIPKIVAVTAGLYTVNPKMFVEATSTSPSS